MRLLANIATAVLWSGSSGETLAQSPTDASPLQVVHFQYQVNYPRPWIGIPGPGLSLGGTISSQRREGISSWYGIPFPAPLGAGFYINNPEFYGEHTVQPQSWILGSPLVGRAVRKQDHAEPKRVTWTSPIQRKQVVPVSVSLDETQPSGAVPINDEVAQSRHLGDMMMLQQQWSGAIEAYRTVVDREPDHADHRMRLALAAVSAGDYPLAVSEFKQAAILKPAVISSIRAGDVFGRESESARRLIRSRIVAWSREALDDPDRLFLLGVWLSVERDPRSRELLSAADRLDPNAEHLKPFLTQSITARDHQTFP